MPSINEIESQVKRMESSIDQAKLDSSKLEGTIESLEQRMRDEFRLNSEEEVVAELDKLNKEIEELEERIVKKFEKISEEYEW